MKSTAISIAKLLKKTVKSGGQVVIIGNIITDGHWAIDRSTLSKAEQAMMADVETASESFPKYQWASHPESNWEALKAHHGISDEDSLVEYKKTMIVIDLEKEQYVMYRNCKNVCFFPKSQIEALDSPLSFYGDESPKHLKTSCGISVMPTAFHSATLDEVVRDFRMMEKSPSRKDLTLSRK